MVIWTFLRPSGQSGKGVGGARVCALNYCSIAKWSRVAKWVNILLDKSIWYLPDTLRQSLLKNTLTYFVAAFDAIICFNTLQWYLYPFRVAFYKPTSVLHKDVLFQLVNVYFVIDGNFKWTTTFNEENTQEFWIYKEQS